MGDGVKRGTACVVHRHREAVPEEDHHVKPQEYGGEKTWNGLPNLARVCSNAHGNTHYFMDLLFKFHGNVPWLVRRTFGKKTRDLATEGYRRVILTEHPLHVATIREHALKRLEEDTRGD